MYILRLLTAHTINQYNIRYFYLGIPIGVGTSNIKLAREFELPRKVRLNDWQIMRDGGPNRSRKFMALPFTTNKLSITRPEQVIFLIGLH